MKKILLILLSCVVSILFANEVELTKEEKTWLKQKKVLTVANVSTYPPFNFTMTGTPIGYTIDYMNLIGQSLGVKFKFVNKTWVEHISDLKEGKLDIIPHFVKNESRTQYADFTNFNHLEYYSGMAIKKDSSIESIDDLKGKHVTIGNGTWLHRYIEKKFPSIILEPIALKENSEFLESIQVGKAVAHIGSIPTMNYNMKKNFITGLKAKRIKKLGISDKIALPMAVKKGNQLLLRILEKANLSLSYSELNKLNDKWFFNTIKTDKIEFNIEEKQWLKDHPILRVQNLNTFPPFNFNENGIPLGYTIDYMDLLAEYMGVKIEYIKDKSWNDYLGMLKEGSLDIIPHIAITQEREKFVDFTHFNHIEYTLGIAIQKDAEIKSMKDLKDKIIAVTNNTFLHDHLKNKFPNQSLLLTESTSKAVEAVSLGKADAVIGSLPALNYYIQKNWFSNIKTDKIEELGLPNKTQLPMGVAKGNKTLLSILEKVNNKVSYKTVKNLKEKWMDIPTISKKIIHFTDKEQTYLYNKKEINLCINSNWMPFEKVEDSKHIGIVSEYFELFKEKVKIPIKIVPTKNMDESIDYTKQRKCDLVSVTFESKNALDKIDFSKPYIDTSIVIATRVETPFINYIPSLQNKKIGVLKGCVGSKILKVNYPYMKLIYVDSIEEGLNKVSNKELFGFIGPLLTVGPLIQVNFIGDVKVGGKLEETWNLSIGVRNDEPYLKNIVNKFVNSISEESHKRIMNKWNSLTMTSSIDYTKLLYISLFFIIVIFIVLYKNRSINIINKELILAHEEIKEQQNMVDKYVLIVETDINGIIKTVNDVYCKTLGYTKEELIGKTHKFMRYPSAGESFFKELWQTIEKDETWSGEMFNYTKNKEIKCLFTNINAIYRENIKVGYRGICEDITDKKRVEELSITDNLTKIYNRMKLDELISKQVASFERYELPFSIVLLDIDNFKMVNDTYGHDVGDDVLKQLANVLEKNTRQTDLVGRWGGEEFLIICPNTVSKNASIVAEHIRFLIEQEYFNEVGSITVSIGIAQFEKDDTIISIFKKADNALYEAKNSGKNCTIIYNNKK